MHFLIKDIIVISPYTFGVTSSVRLLGDDLTKLSLFLLINASLKANLLHISLYPSIPHTPSPMLLLVGCFQPHKSAFLGLVRRGSLRRKSPDKGTRL